MQEEKTIPTIAVEDLEENGIYFNSKNELIKILEVDKEKQELRLYNIAERYTTYYVKLNSHNLIRRVR